MPVLSNSGEGMSDLAVQAEQSHRRLLPGRWAGGNTAAAAALLCLTALELEGQWQA